MAPHLPGRHGPILTWLVVYFTLTTPPFVYGACDGFCINHGFSCEFFYHTSGTSCEVLEEEFNCDCRDCVCPTTTTTTPPLTTTTSPCSLGCITDDTSCDDWPSISCPKLEEYFHCNCTACAACATTTAPVPGQTTAAALTSPFNFTDPRSTTLNAVASTSQIVSEAEPLRLSTAPFLVSTTVHATTQSHLTTDVPFDSTYMSTSIPDTTISESARILIEVEEKLLALVEPVQANATSSVEQYFRHTWKNTTCCDSYANLISVDLVFGPLYYDDLILDFSSQWANISTEPRTTTLSSSSPTSVASDVNFSTAGQVPMDMIRGSPWGANNDTIVAILNVTPYSLSVQLATAVAVAAAVAV